MLNSWANTWLPAVTAVEHNAFQEYQQEFGVWQCVHHPDCFQAASRHRAT